MSGPGNRKDDPGTDAPLLPGDRRAFQLVFAQHHEAVLHAATLVCGPASAPAVVQEVFSRLWVHPGGFDPRHQSLQKYLTKQAYCRSVDRLRSESATSRQERRETSGAGADTPGNVEDLGRCEQIRNEVLRLPASQTRPIMLALFGGHSYRQVAEVLSVPEGTVKRRIRAGLATLRARLGDAAG